MAQPKSFFRKLMKVLSYGVLLLVAGLAIAHFAWKYSGSNKWELVREARGVKVYALKTPGQTRQQFKAVTRVKTSLDRVVATYTDTSTEGCRNFVPGCDSGAVLKPWDQQSLSYTQAYRIKPPSPFLPRDLVIKTQMSRDPQSRALLMEMSAVPELVPANACCVRMTHMHNRWRFTPAGDGLFDVEFVQDDDPVIPYFLYNRVVPIGLTYLRKNLERVTAKDKYGHTEYAFLK